MSRQGQRRKRLTMAMTGLVSLLAVLTMTACQKPNGHGLSTGIVNGTTATGNEAWAGTVIGIGTKESTGYSIYCSGTLVGENTVVTAAHCVEAMSDGDYVVFGLVESGKATQGRKIVKKAFHEKWAGIPEEDSRDVFDIGVAQFEGTAPAGYKPAGILADDSILINGAEVLLVGYGVTNGTYQNGSGILRYTKVKIRDAKFGQTELQTDETANGSCNGDSGGPGLVEVNGQFYLWGATSRGDAACTNNGIYTKVTSYRDWVTEKMHTWSSKPMSLMAAGF